MKVFERIAVEILRRAQRLPSALGIGMMFVDSFN
jgi:hypothetical protein